MLEDSDSDEDDRFSAQYNRVKSLQVNFIDRKMQNRTFVPVNNLLFMSIHKLNMLLLIMFIKLFEIQFSYHGVWFRVCKFREALISRFFYNREKKRN